jgi:alkylation response protein AidB-like acyl-CoA dehydrogenase
MIFEATETQELLKNSMSRLLRDRFTFKRRQDVIVARDQDPLWRDYTELGLFGVEIDDAYGGLSGGFADLAVVLEEMGRGLTLDAYLPNQAVGAALARLGDAAQQASWLPAIVDGELKIVLAHSEANARYQTSHIETTASSRDQQFVLNGTKTIVLGGATANLFIVPARTSGACNDAHGVTLFVVRSDAPGVQVRAYELMDNRSAADVTLDNVQVPASAVLGRVGEGLAALGWALDRGAAAACCETLGAMRAVNELTSDYLKTRKQFGRPIGAFQVLQHRMADMVTAEHQARSMLFLAIDAVQNEDAAARAQAISAAKAQIGLAARVVGRGAIQLHGGIGMTMEYSVGHYFRRLTTLERMFGDIDYHLARFAALDRASRLTA